MEGILTALIGAVATVLAVWFAWFLSKKSKRRLPKEVEFAVKLGYSIQELFSILDTADPRIYDNYYMTSERKAIFDQCKSKVSALCGMLKIKNLDKIDFQYDETPKVRQHFVSIFDSMPNAVSYAFKIGMALGLITLRHVPYFFRFKLIKQDGGSAQFLTQATCEYNSMNSLWLGLTGERKLPSAFGSLRALLDDVKSLEPKDGEIKLDEMSDLIMQCDAASKHVFSEIETRLDKSGDLQ